MSADEGKPEGPWSNICAGLLLVGANVGLYYYLTSFEERVGEERVPWFLALIYNNFGKWGVLAITGLIAISVLIRGIYRLIFERE